MLRNESALKKLYNVRVPLVYTYEDWEIEELGVPVNESIGYSYRNQKFKKSSAPAHKELTNCYLSLYRIIQIANEGGTIWFVNPEEIEKVFMILEDLIGKYDKFSRGLNAFYNKNEDAVFNEIKMFIKTIYGNNSKTIYKKVEDVNNSNRFGLANTLSKPIDFSANKTNTTNDSQNQNTDNGFKYKPTTTTRDNMFRKTIIPPVYYNSEKGSL